jgi:hypothetical protein
MLSRVMTEERNLYFFSKCIFTCYLRSFYLRFRLFAIKENIPKFRIRRLSLSYSQFLINLDLNNHFGAAQYSLVIRAFRIRGVFPERVYRDLRGPSVFHLDVIHK